MVKRVMFITIFVIFAVFILQNTEVVEVRFWFWKAQASRALVLLITFIVGLGIGWLTGIRKKASGPKEKVTGSKRNANSSANSQPLAP